MTTMLGPDGKLKLADKIIPNTALKAPIAAERIT
jgi:hypothetical protein